MEKKEIQIKAKDEDLKGKYVNSLIVTHTKEEFCLDFLLQGFNPPILVVRIFTSPTHFKRMIGALNENLKKYEEKFGEIKIQREEFSTEETNIGFKP